MSEDDVRNIFHENKNFLMEGLKPDNSPCAFILGGQGASGKGLLSYHIAHNYSTVDFLNINGDDFRVYHPDWNNLKTTPAYSRETQIFSSVFTEGLIRECATRRISLIIEGTMRNPQTPITTAEFLRSEGYRVGAYVIAAPKEFTTMGVYNRYVKEQKLQGWGRLAEIASHDAAVRGLPLSVDELYRQKIVDKLAIYTHLAQKKEAEYILDGNEWNNDVLPSVIIERSREQQISDKAYIRSIMEEARSTLSSIEDRYKQAALQAFCALNRLQIENVHFFKHKDGQFYIQAQIRGKTTYPAVLSFSDKNLIDKAEKTDKKSILLDIASRYFTGLSHAGLSHSRKR